MELILGVFTAILLLTLSVFRPGYGVSLALCMPMIHPGIGADASFLGVASPGILLIGGIIRIIFFPAKSDQNTISFVDMIMLLWLAYLPISVLITEPQSVGVLASVRAAYMGLSFYFTTRLLCATSGVSEFCLDFMMGMVILGVFITGLALYLDESASEFITRLTIGKTYIGLSNYITLALLCALFMVFYMKDKVMGIARLGSFAAVPFLFYGMLLCNTRGVVVALVVSVFFLLVRSLLSNRIDRNVARRGMFGIAMAIAGGIGGAIAFPDVWARMGAKFNQMVEGSADSDVARLDLYQAAMDMFYSKPLLGEGIGSYEHLMRTYPHNLMLETMADMGLVGLILVVLVVIGSLVLAVRYQSINALFISALLVLQITESQVSLGFWMNKNLFVFVGMATAIHLLHMGPRMPRKAGKTKGRSRRKRRVKWSDQTVGA